MDNENRKYVPERMKQRLFQKKNMMLLLRNTAMLPLQDSLMVHQTLQNNFCTVRLSEKTGQVHRHLFYCRILVKQQFLHRHEYISLLLQRVHNGKRRPHRRLGCIVQ